MTRTLISTRPLCAAARPHVFVLALLSAGLLSASAAQAVPVTYANDGSAQLINVIRRYDNALPLFSVSQVVTGSTTAATVASAVDGGETLAQWNGVNDAGDSASVRITLDQVYSLRRFVQQYNNGVFVPANYDIKVSTTGFGSMTSVASGGVPGLLQTNTLASPVNAQYIELTMTGQGGANPNILLSEFQAFVDASAGLTTNGGWNAARPHVGAPALSVTNLSPAGFWIDSVTNVIDSVMNDGTYLRGNAGVGNAQFLLDLGSVHLVESIGLGFYSGQTWASGMMIEASTDNVNWSTVYNTGSAQGQGHVNITDSLARYFRVTDYNRSGGAMSEFEVFADAMPAISSTPVANSTIDLGEGNQFTTILDTNALSITNNGESTSELQILSFAITGADPAVFDVPDFAVTTLTVGGTDTVQFDLEAALGAAYDTYNATLTFTTNVGDLVFQLQANSTLVPEPSTWSMLGLGAAALVWQIRRRK